MHFISSSPLTTQKIAKLCAQEVLRSPSRKHAFIIGLQGELGAGKTTFIKGFAKALGVKGRVTSPTFLILRTFPIPLKKKKLLHIDAYRIKPRDLIALGIRSLIEDPQNIIVIEWAEKVRKLLPKKLAWFEFTHGKKENERTIYAHA